ncbi:hypothetical protein [Bradyrhizobium elkanii]|uniref:hypothetical protein n=1 Tax=Bradyrhizobium elkanii TaxID=29448 RepID=UPI001448E6CE|nr:hypothetical protein [Bradyrhizobium elkanii]MCP1932499.1 hypothetical protein [Bradyrhizobium elkanii]MCS3479574.1 hypothetical protein [Bradyrhizobium elkanii]MCS3576962.1 hypothetical protein [Bradyrhizobium elkanii]MCS3719839.1 hypothetical protein [Bradyrhizobium elkanii]MCS4004256.1 hypothetical protein [Bradyrhizobium elkanii USDA 61]
MDIKIGCYGPTPQKTSASTELRVAGGSGERKALLYGYGMTERGARQQLLEQAKALRNELNLAIEDMIEELCSNLRDKPLAERQAALQRP